MTKKSEIIEKLNEGKDVDEIVNETGSAKSYVYRLQRELKENDKNNENFDDSKNSDMDNSDEHITDRNSNEMDRNKEGMEEKKNEQHTDNTGAVGGVKKKKKSTKKTLPSSKRTTKVDSEPKTKEQNSTFGGIKLWMMLKWKKLLLILTLLILLITAILLSLMKKPKEPMNQTIQSRYPVLQ